MGAGIAVVLVVVVEDLVVVVEDLVVVVEDLVVVVPPELGTH